MLRYGTNPFHQYPWWLSYSQCINGFIDPGVMHQRWKRDQLITVIEYRMYYTNPKCIFLQKPRHSSCRSHSVLYRWHPWSTKIPLRFHKLLILIQHPVSHSVRMLANGCKFHFLILECRASFTYHLWEIWSAAQRLAWVSLSLVIATVVHAVIHGALPATWPHQMGWEDASTDAIVSICATIL